ncbi:MAG: hypothetical protein JSR67_03810 [Proteobacteria bacterium]|nr:hypothetical protein [Pseudomonadota bacterium]
MTDRDLDRALHLYEQFVQLLLRANRAPAGSMERWEATLRYRELRAELDVLLAEWRRGPVPVPMQVAL